MRERDQRTPVAGPKLDADGIVERDTRRDLGRASVPTPMMSGASTSASSRRSHGLHVRTIAADGLTSLPPGRFPGKHLATAAM